MTRLKQEAVASLVRKMIKDGAIKPGGAVPSYTALAKRTGFSAETCRQGLRPLLKDGTLAPGASRTARLRVAQHRPGRDAALRDALSRTLASLRREKGLTQADLAGLLNVSATTVGLAETSRGKQSRGFWQHAGQLLGDDGRLVRTYDTYQAALHAGAPEEAGGAAPGEPAPAGPVLPVSVSISAEGVLVTWPGGAQALARPPGGPG